MNPVQIYYGVIFLLSVILTCCYVYTLVEHKHFNISMTLMYTFIPISNLGYLSYSQSETLDALVRSLQFTYLGGCFLILFILFSIINLCKKEIPDFVKVICLFLSMLVYLCVLTIGQNKLFYTEVDVVRSEYGYVLGRSYGPMHTVFYILTIAYFIYSLYVVISTYFTRKDVSRWILWLLFIPEVVAFFSFFGGRIITDKIDFIPAAYVFAQVMYLFIIHRICLYDISETAIESINEEGNTGFLSLDFDLNFLAANNVSYEVFDDLDDLTVDKSLKRAPELYKLISEHVEIFKNDENKDKFHYEKDDKVYLIDINYLIDHKKKRGYQIVITDDTRDQKYIKLLDNYNADLEKEVAAKTRDIVRMHNNLIKSIAMMVESRDNSTGGHIVRTSDVVEILMSEIEKDDAFVKENGITEKFISDIIKAAPMHDIGKIAVDDAVLKKPGRFTDEEFEIMKKHAPEGARVLHEILKSTDDESFKVLAENVAHYHHERMDGSGYPEGLTQDEIPIEARIMAIADVYDALVSKRVYKDSMSFEKADSIMMESMGKHFDKRLEKFYVAARPRIEQYYVGKYDQ